MKHYELLCVLPGTLAEDEVSPIVESIKSILTEAKVENIELHDNGKSRLAYPIKHIRYGYQFIFEFEAEAAAIPQIQGKLGLNRDLLRALITIFDPAKRAEAKDAIAKAAVRQEQTKKKQAGIARPSDEKKFTPAEPREPKEAETPDVPATSAKPEEEQTKVESTKTVTEEPKDSDIQELDKKLDDILDSALEDL